MNKVMIGLVLMCLASNASAWYCESHSNTGQMGWGRSSDLYAAKDIAMYNCRVRTPYWGVCRAPDCW